MKGINSIYQILRENFPDFWRYHYTDHYSDFFIKEKLMGKGSDVNVPRDIDCFLDKELMKASMVHNYLTHVGVYNGGNESLSSLGCSMLRMLSLSPDIYLDNIYGSRFKPFYPNVISFFCNTSTEITNANLVSYTDNEISKLTEISTRQYDVKWWSNGMEGLKYFYPFVPTCRPPYRYQVQQSQMLYRYDPSVAGEGDLGIITGDLISSKCPIIAHATPAFAINKAMSMGCSGISAEMPYDWYPNAWPNSTFGVNATGGTTGAKVGYPVILFVINDPLSLARNGARFSSLEAGQIYISSKARYKVTSIGRLDWEPGLNTALTQGVTVVEVTLEDVSGGEAKDMYTLPY